MLWYSSTALWRIVACCITVRNSGTYVFGFAFHHHGQPIRIVFGVSGPRPAHWIALRLPSLASVHVTVIAKPFTAISFIRASIAARSRSASSIASTSSPPASRSMIAAAITSPEPWRSWFAIENMRSWVWPATSAPCARDDDGPPPFSSSASSASWTNSSRSWYSSSSCGFQLASRCWVKSIASSWRMASWKRRPWSAWRGGGGGVSGVEVEWR